MIGAALGMLGGAAGGGGAMPSPSSSANSSAKSGDSGDQSVMIDSATGAMNVGSSTGISNSTIMVVAGVAGAAIIVMFLVKG